MGVNETSSTPKVHGEVIFTLKLHKNKDAEEQ